MFNSVVLIRTWGSAVLGGFFGPLKGFDMFFFLIRSLGQLDHTLGY